MPWPAGDSDLWVMLLALHDSQVSYLLAPALSSVPARRSATVHTGYQMSKAMMRIWLALVALSTAVQFVMSQGGRALRK
jgi:alpha-D-ribose 1-methylphosphonate 5-triphosphate synthase subunit PhnH